MTKILQGVRVVELASWVFVPAAAAVLGDWGADVIKIEHPGTGDPVRGLSASSIPTNSPNAAWGHQQDVAPPSDDILSLP